MYNHPDITRAVVRQRHSELLEQARLERLAAIGDSDPELAARFARVRGVVSGLQLRLERRRIVHGRTGFAAS